MSGVPPRGRSYELPAALRGAILADGAPVTPLASPVRRSLVMALPALAVVACGSAWQMARLGAGPVWRASGAGVSLLEWLVGAGVLWLALREAVPGRGLGALRDGLAVAAVLALEIAVGVGLARQGTGARAPVGGLASGAGCGVAEGALGLLSLAVAAWLVVRALPLRPAAAGALAGAAAGLFADAIWHLACARTDLEHLLVWHVGASAALVAIGAVAGALWERRAITAA